MIILSVVFSTTVLGYAGKVDSAAVTTILGGIVSGLLVGHYVKTTNGAMARPTETTASVVDSKLEVTTRPSERRHGDEGP